MSEILVGVALGLAAAFLQSLCYIVSGSYVRRTGLPGWTLTAPQRAVMLVPYAVLTWLACPDSLDGVGFAALMWTLVIILATYFGDVGLFQMQKTVEPSRVAPLQAMKIPLIAVLSFFALGHVYSVGQVAGIALVLASAGVLFGAGQRIGPSAWFWLAVCSGGFAVSDVALGCLLAGTRESCGSVLKSSFFALGLTGTGSSLVAVAALAFQRRSRGTLPSVGQCLRYAVPYGFLWMAAMVFLFVCFSLSGVVLGTIAQSTRGLMSVALGWFLVRHGFADLESEASVSVFVRRAAAALLIILAMALYVAG